MESIIISVCTQTVHFHDASSVSTLLGCHFTTDSVGIEPLAASLAVCSSREHGTVGAHLWITATAGDCFSSTYMYCGEAGKRYFRISLIWPSDWILLLHVGFEEVWRKLRSMNFFRTGQHSGVYQLFSVPHRWFYPEWITPPNLNDSTSHHVKPHRWKLGLFAPGEVFALERLMLELSPFNGFHLWLTKSTRKGRRTTADHLHKSSGNIKFSCVIFAWGNRQKH